MTALWQSPIFQPLFQTLGWTLIHSLWQGALVWGIAAVMLRLLRHKSPQARYAAACGALGAMFLLIVATYGYLANQAAPVIPNPVETAEAAKTTIAVAASIEPVAAASVGDWLARSVPWLSVGWMFGVLALSIRLLGGWYWLFHGLKRGATPAPPEWQRRVADVSRSLGVKRVVRLLVSHKLKVPIAVGWIKPAVLLPASALLRLTPEALEAILAHELAHIRRHDFVVNLLQSIVEVLFFYHPATWWLSGQIRELREHCCDDAAVRHCGSPVSYASALAKLETLRARSAPPQLAPAANGASLMKRIQRLLSVPEPATSGPRAGLIAAVILSVLGASALWGFNDSQKKPESQRISIKDGNTSLNVQMRGNVKLDTNSRDGVILGDGASLEIASKEKEATRRFTVSREGDDVKKTYRVNGQEKPLDSEAEEWIKNQIQEIKAVETRKIYLIANSNDKISFEITEDGAEGKDSKVIVYSNKAPAVALASPLFFDGGSWSLNGKTQSDDSSGIRLFFDGKSWSLDRDAWNGFFISDGRFDTEEIRKRTEENLKKLEGLRIRPSVSIEEWEAFLGSNKERIKRNESFTAQLDKFRQEAIKLWHEKMEGKKASELSKEESERIQTEINAEIVERAVKLIEQLKDQWGLILPGMNIIGDTRIDINRGLITLLGTSSLQARIRSQELHKQRIENEIERLKSRIEQLNKELGK